MYKITAAYRNEMIKRSTERTLVIGEPVLSDQLIESCKESYTCDKGQRKVLAMNRNNWNMDIDVSWIAAAAQTYQISPDINDYLITDVAALSAGIPNRNMQGFLFDELSYFDYAHGKMIYSTFIGKPSCANHANQIDQNPDLAKGVIFASALQYLPEYNIYKVRLLQGWDRTKDTRLIHEIETGKRRYYSMGALVSIFLDSITGQPTQPGQSTHPPGSIVNGHLAWSICCGVVFIENSSVLDAADPTASGIVY